MPYPAQREAIAACARAYPGRTVVESNGPGDPVIENLTVRDEPFQTNARTKVNAIQALRLLLEKRAIKADIPVLPGELLAYQWDDSSIRQDRVMALAIAALHLPSPDEANEPPPPPPSIGPLNRTMFGNYREIQLWWPHQAAGVCRLRHLLRDGEVEDESVYGCVIGMATGGSASSSHEHECA